MLKNHARNVWIEDILDQSTLFLWHICMDVGVYVRMRICIRENMIYSFCFTHFEKIFIFIKFPFALDNWSKIDKSFLIFVEW